MDGAALALGRLVRCARPTCTRDTALPTPEGWCLRCGLDAVYEAAGLVRRKGGYQDTAAAVALGASPLLGHVRAQLAALAAPAAAPSTPAPSTPAAPRRGRPAGFRCSAETRARMSAAHRARHAARRAAQAVA
jgi:hypothetical protein